MANIKKVTLAEAKKLQESVVGKTDKPLEEKQTETPQSQEEISRLWTTPEIQNTDPPEEILEKETEEILKKYEEEDAKDPDVEEAKRIKEKIQEEKNKPKPTDKKPNRKPATKKPGKPRPCKRCKTSFTPKENRSRYCPTCAPIVAREGAAESGGRPPLVQSEVEEKLRPFLRLGFNLKESCLEAELGYSTILEKLKTWEGFPEFVERHKNYSILKAKRNIFAINGDLKTYGAVEVGKNSRWLLERRRPDEYGPRVNIDTTPGGSSTLDPEKEKIMQQLLASRNLWQQQLEETTAS